MALATEQSLYTASVRTGLTDALVRPVQLIADWVTVIAAGAVNEADESGTPRTPEDSASTPQKFAFEFDGACTLLAVRMGYDDGDTPNADPVVQLFGRVKNSSNNGSWMRLYNRADTPATSITLVTAETTDYHDLTYFYTEVNPKTHVVDTMGCDEFIVLIETAYTVSGGNAALAFIQVKPL